MERGRPIDFRFERRRERGERSAGRPILHRRRRHHSSAELLDHPLGEFRVLVDVRRVEMLERYPAGLRVVVVAGGAVRGDQFVLRIGRQEHRPVRGRRLRRRAAVILLGRILCASGTDSRRQDGDGDTANPTFLIQVPRRRRLPAAGGPLTSRAIQNIAVFARFQAPFMVSGCQELSPAGRASRPT